MTKNQIKIALTFDVERDLSHQITKTGDKYYGIKKSIPLLTELFNKHQVPATWFITHDNFSKIDKELSSYVEKMSENGEIGCHVHFYTNSDDQRKYDQTKSFQTILIENATKSLRETGLNVTSFRGGANFFNEDTIKILESLNYKLDSSVIPGMYSKKIRNLNINHKKRLSPEPYFMSYLDHCKPGDSTLLEVPITICPIYQFNSKPFSILISKKISMSNSPNITLDNINTVIKYYNRIKPSNKPIPVVISAHTYDFIDNTDKQLQNIESFIIKSKEDFNAEFVTMDNIRTDYQNNIYEPQTNYSDRNLTTSDILHCMSILSL